VLVLFTLLTSLDTQKGRRTKGGAACFGCAEVTLRRVSVSPWVTKVEAADGDPRLQPIASPRECRKLPHHGRVVGMGRDHAVRDGIDRGKGIEEVGVSRGVELIRRHLIAGAFADIPRLVVADLAPIATAAAGRARRRASNGVRTVARLAWQGPSHGVGIAAIPFRSLEAFLVSNCTG